MKLKLFCLTLSISIISCTSNNVITKKSPLPEQNPSSSSTSNLTYLKISNDKICYNKEISISGNVNLNMVDLENDTASIYLENVTNSEGQVPPLRYEHILLNKFGIQVNKDFNYSFRVEENIKSFDGSSVLTLKPGNYSLYLGFSNKSLYGIGSFELKNCL